MAQSTESGTTRKAIISTLVTALLSPVSLVIGFYFGHALQKPELSIVDSTNHYVLKSHELSDKILSDVSSNPILAMTLRFRLQQAAYAKSEDSCTSWMNGDSWNDGCIESVLEAAHSLASDILAEKDRPVPDFLRGMKLPAGKAKRLAGILDELISEVNSFKSDGIELLTGDMDFDVGVLNTGDFDGVVSKYGSIRFSGGSFAIVSGGYKVIKAHGYDIVTFSAHDVPVEQRPLFAKWQEIVRSKKGGEFEILLESGDKKSMTFKMDLST